MFNFGFSMNIAVVLFNLGHPLLNSFGVSLLTIFDYKNLSFEQACKKEKADFIKR